MNYLGHAFLSGNDPQILCGNMIGDFVKGSHALNDYPEGVRKGLLLHRHIDTFTDQHPAVAEAKAVFRPAYGLYSGAFVDTVTDHFLANDPGLFADEIMLAGFAEDVYSRMATQSEYFPVAYRPFYQSMVTHNWLLNYRSLAGLMSALNGLKRRAAHISETETAMELMQEHYAFLQTCYTRFMRDIILYVKIELAGD